jgi:hypothetical protein
LFVQNACQFSAQKLGQQGLGLCLTQYGVVQCVHDLVFLSFVDREQRGSALHGVEGEVSSQRQTQKKFGWLV